MKSRAEILHKLTSIVSYLTGLEPSEIDPDAKLTPRYFDEWEFLELTLRAEDEFGIELPGKGMSVRSLTLAGLAEKIEGMLK